MVAEFDTPGHTRSWGVSHPELLTACEGVFSGRYGPIDPSNEGVYTFMQTLLNEIVHVFPDEYVHLGGDEGKTLFWVENFNAVQINRPRTINFSLFQLGLNAGNQANV